MIEPIGWIIAIYDWLFWDSYIYPVAGVVAFLTWCDIREALIRDRERDRVIYGGEELSDADED